MNTALEHRDHGSLEPHPRNEELYGTPELDDDFVDSIRRHGIREPIVTNTDGVITSGHRRYAAAELLDLDEVPVRVEHYESDYEQLQALLDHNRQRQKTPAQKVNEYELQLEIEEERAQERQEELGKTSGEDPSGRFSRRGTRARDEAAEKIGADVSGRTLEKGRKVKEKAEEGDEHAREEWEKLESGEQSLHGAYETVAQPDDEADADAEPDDEDEDVACAVCGDAPIDQGELEAREGETLDVRLCIDEYPSEYNIHLKQGGEGSA